MNKIVLMGRLTADPELRTTPNGVSVTSFTIAVQRDYARQGEERQTDFFDIVAWRGTAEFVNRYFSKGNMIAVAGSMQTRSYVDKNGNNRKAYEVVADNIYFTGEKRGSSSDGGSYQQASTPAAAYSSGSTEDFEDMPSDEDLPF